MDKAGIVVKASCLQKSAGWRPAPQLLRHGVSSLSPDTLGAKAGIDLFSRTYKTCLAVADTQNQRIIEWDLDPSAWPGNPGQRFQEMLYKLQAQNAEAAVDFFMPELEADMRMIFHATINTIHLAAAELLTRPLVPVSFQGTQAIYIMVFEETDDQGNPQEIHGEIEFYQNGEGIYFIKRM